MVKLFSLSPVWLPAAVFLLVSFAAFGQPEKNYADVKQRKQFYKQLSEKYSSATVKEILGTDAGNEFEEYIDGHTEKELVSSYPTIIHELLHGYNGSENHAHEYFIEPGVRIHVPFTQYYNSKELNKFVRKGQQDSIFRYGLYVGEKNEMGKFKFEGINNSKSTEVMSVSMGIYGMVEEFDAYYQGDLAAFELYGYFMKTYGEKNPEAWEDYEHMVLGNALAYYELNLFIGWYLEFARKNHPEIYKELMANKALRVAYTLIDNKYKDLLKKIDKQIAVIPKSSEVDPTDVLDFSGSEADMYRFFQLAGLEEEDIFEEVVKTVNGKKVVTKKMLLEPEELAMLKKEYLSAVAQYKQQGGDGLLLFYAKPLLSMEYVKKQYTKEVNQELSAFRINGVTPQNYKDYLK